MEQLFDLGYTDADKAENKRKHEGVAISMGGRGRTLDNIFFKRL